MIPMSEYMARRLFTSSFNGPFSYIRRIRHNGNTYNTQRTIISNTDWLNNKASRAEDIPAEKGLQAAIRDEYNKPILNKLSNILTLIERQVTVIRQSSPDDYYNRIGYLSYLNNLELATNIAFEKYLTLRYKEKQSNTIADRNYEALKETGPSGL